MVLGYCLKEKKKVEMKNPKFELNKIGARVAIGVCPSCNTKMYKLLGKDEGPASLVSKRKPSSKKSKKGGASKKSRSRKSKGSKGSKKSRSRKSKGSRKSRSRKSKK